MTAAGATSPAFDAGSIVVRLNRWIAVLILGVISIGLWAAFVPLATSIHTAGHLRSRTPEFAVQHPVGGRIEEVLVTPLDAVEAGQLLIRLDVSRDRAQLAELEREVAQISNENTQITAILDKLDHPADRADEGANEHDESASWASFRRHLAERATGVAQLSALHDQAIYLEQGLLRQRGRVASIEARDARQRALADKGLSTNDTAEALHEDLLQAKSRLSADEGQLRQIEHDIQTQSLEMELQDARFREALQNSYTQNLRRLPGLRREIIQIRDRISQAEVRAPASGIVSSLPFGAAHMFAPQGATLLSVSQPLDGAEITFDLSPMVVDQVHIGMRGILTIPSLPQRQTPKLHVEITSLSPVASRDDTGAPVSFQGRARLAEEDVEKLAQLTRTGTRLVDDMPVSISFAGREVTFFDYLIRPFVDGLSMAMQD